MGLYLVRIQPLACLGRGDTTAMATHHGWCGGGRRGTWRGSSLGTGYLGGVLFLGNHGCVTIYSIGCIGLLGSKLIHNLGVDEDIIKQQDSVADASAVEVGEEEAGDDL